jgi:hypothetical protein
VRPAQKVLGCPGSCPYPWARSSVVSQPAFTAATMSRSGAGSRSCQPSNPSLWGRAPAASAAAAPPQNSGSLGSLRRAARLSDRACAGQTCQVARQSSTAGALAPAQWTGPRWLAVRDTRSSHSHLAVAARRAAARAALNRGARPLLRLQRCGQARERGPRLRLQPLLWLRALGARIVPRECWQSAPPSRSAPAAHLNRRWSADCLSKIALQCRHQARWPADR